MGHPDEGRRPGFASFLLPASQGRDTTCFMTSVSRVLLHLADRRRRLVDPADVYLLEADEDDTLVRLRSRHPLRDLRPLGEVFAVFEPFGFVRIHTSWAVNLNRTREVRPADERDSIPAGLNCRSSLFKSSSRLTHAKSVA